MPYPVQNIIEGRAEPVCANPGDLVSSALEKMIERDFSQLPVIDERNRPMGMVTQESILQALINFGNTPDQLHVSDAIVRAPMYRPEDDLLDLLDRLRDSNAVLIVDGDQKLIGIVTTYDSTEYFRQRAEDMMLIEDIESMLKDMILNAFTGADGEIDREKLNHTIAEKTSINRGLKERYRNGLKAYLHQQGISNVDPENLENSFTHLAEKERPVEFELLTFNAYIDLLLCPECWSFNADTLNIKSNALKKLLEEVRDTRNKLAHFRGDITASQRDQLRFCVDWLTRHQAAFPVSLPVTKEVNHIPDHVLREPESDYGVEARPDREIVPLEEQISPTESRYTPLAIWLQGQPGSIDHIQLTFDEVEQIIGEVLPNSALVHRAWWANNDSHTHARSWLNAGWRTSRVSMIERRLSFNRIIEREKAYIKFFAGLLKLLKREAKFKIKDVSPDGQCWIIVASLPDRGQQIVFFNISFARDRRLRVELYIDTGEQLRNKCIFDKLYSQKEEIEERVEENINWERMSDKRASRIAIYSSGHIMDDKSKLDELMKWAVRAMIDLYDALNKAVSEAISICSQNGVFDIRG